MHQTHMITASGRLVDPLNLTSEDFDLGDIAHALSLVCRFGGHTRVHYSVAQHSVILSEMFRDRSLARWALLHDAAEAYLGDVVSPLKRGLMEYRELERRVLAALASRYRLEGEAVPMVVKLADRYLTEVESHQLVADHRSLAPWPIYPTTPDHARRRFLGRCVDLGLRQEDDRVA